MRTLVLGLPLPPVTFDNSSFLSAPSLFDYGRVIVETSALSEAIEQVTAGSTEHRTYGGLTVVNGPGGAAAFSLAGLLRLRPPGAGRARAPRGAAGRLASRACLWEREELPPPHARVFARSPGGAAVGVELEVGPGRVILLPPIGSLDYSSDRAPLAAVLHQCLERMTAGGPDSQSHRLSKGASRKARGRRGGD